MLTRVFMTVAALVTGCMYDSNEQAALFQTDIEVTQSHPIAMQAIVTSIGRPTDEGLLGRNREWGALYSARFQYGAGRALRYGIATNDDEISRLAQHAINAGINTIQDDGSIPVSLPEHLANQYQPDESDQASAATFFLSDACPALSLSGGTVAQKTKISRASTWLTEKKPNLLHRDRRAPNRLLINALAFVSCAQLLEDRSLSNHADDFIAAALEFAREDGVFVEAGGSDTSYQAVNLVAAHEILALGYQGPHANDLHEAWSKGVVWLNNRIYPQGYLDSSDNTRTCAGEDFLGRPKSVDLREVFRALAYADAEDTKSAGNLSAFKAWLMTRPGSCEG